MKKLFAMIGLLSSLLAVAEEPIYQIDFDNGLDGKWRTLRALGSYAPETVNGRFRITDRSHDLSTAVTLDYEFPTDNNKFVMEFDYYAYGGCRDGENDINETSHAGEWGADGLSIVLYDTTAGVSPRVGASGGSLGYANGNIEMMDGTYQEQPGFAKGWLGIGLDEFGAYGVNMEDRKGSDGTTFNKEYVNGIEEPNSVVIRGSEASGYRLLYKDHVNQLADINAIDFLSGHYRLTIDSTTADHLYVTLERREDNTQNYTKIVDNFDAMNSEYHQGAKPAKFRIGFSAGTGGGCNNHEIDNVKIYGAGEPYDPNPKPFTCETAGAIVSYSTSGSASTGNTNLNYYRLMDGNITQHYTYQNNTLEGVNSIGYNVKDNLIWGYNIPSRQIVSIDANHSYRFYKMDDVPNIDGRYYNAADVSPNGVLYMKADARKSRLDRVVLDYNKTTLHVLDSINLTEPMYADDFAFNPNDGKIYYIDYEQNKLKRIDINGTTGTVVAVSEQNDQFDYPIVTFFDKDGNFYFNAGQEIRKVTFDDRGEVASVTHFSDVQDMTQGDGARCANAPISDEPEPTMVPFSCDFNSYVFTSTHDAGYSTAKLVDFTEETVLTVKDQFADTHINAIGYNPKDNFIYGFGFNDKRLLKVDANYQTQRVDVKPNQNNETLPNDWYYLADVSKNGIYYVAHGVLEDANADANDAKNYVLREIHMVDLNTDTYIGKITLQYPDKEDGSGKIDPIVGADFAINPQDDNLYMLNYRNQQLIQINLQGAHQGEVKELGNTGLAYTYSVATFFDKYGNFYFNAIDKNKKAGIFKIDISHPWSDKNSTKAHATFFSDITISAGDGARCALAAIGEHATLLADYHFDECDYNGTVGEVKDSIGTNDGTTVGGLKTIEGAVGRSVLFHGNTTSNQESIRVDSPDFNLSDNFSIAFWVKIEGDGALLSKKIDVVATADRKLNIFLNNGNSVTTSPLSGWTHVALIKTDAKFKVYLNGNLDKEIDAGTINPQHSQIVVGYKIYDGDDSNKRETSHAFSGAIDELKFYDGILSANDIERIYLNENEGKNSDGSVREAMNCPVPFTCDYNSYVFTSPLDANYSQALLVDIADENIKSAKDSFSDAHINAIGYNPVDNFIYGWNFGDGSNYQTRDRHMVRVDANYNTQRVNIKTNTSGEILPDEDYFLGDISKNGIFYLSNFDFESSENYLKKIEMVDLNNTRYIGKINLHYPGGVTSSDNNGTEGIRGADFAISPVDNQLYMINANNKQLVRIRLDSGHMGEVEELGNVGLKNAYAVATFFDKEGNFYFNADINNTNKIYKIDISNPWSGQNDAKAEATFFSNVTISSGDGARCALASISNKVIFYLSQQKITILETNTTTPNSDGTNGRNIQVTISASKKPTMDIPIRVGQIDSQKEGYIGTAIAGEDYLKREHQVLMFPAGHLTYSFKTSDVIDDSEIENDENFFYLFGVDDEKLGRFGTGNGVEKLEVVIKDDDASDFTAFDPDESDPDLRKRRIKTKVVAQHFTLTLASLNPLGMRDFNSSSTMVKIVDASECMKNIDDINRSDFLHFELPDNDISGDFDFNVSKASRDLRVQFVWKDNKRGLWHRSCSTDHFAVRPKSFSFGEGSGSALKAKAGEYYHLHIIAQNVNNMPSLGYNEVKGSSFAIDANQTNVDCNFTVSDIDDSNLTRFINGHLNGTIKYEDVGQIKFRVHEINGSEFAFVDRNDTRGADRFISEVNKTIEFVPYAFDLDVSYDNPHISGSNDYAFYSNDISSSPAWTITVKAVNKDGNMVENFDKECSAKDVSLNVDLNISGSASKIISSIDDNVTDLNVSSSQVKIPDTIAKDGFVKGKANSTIKINFGRPWTPINPSKLVIDKITASDLSGLSDGNKTHVEPIGGLVYAYMRAYVQSPVSVVGTRRLNTPFYYEAYEDGTASVHLVGLGSQSVSGDRDWHQASYSDNGSAGKMKIKSALAAYPGRVTVTNMGNTALEVNATDLPERNRILITVEPEFATTVSQRISTDVNFIPDSVNWSGKGKTGNVVDTNVSRGTKFKKLNW